MPVNICSNFNIIINYIYLVMSINVNYLSKNIIPTMDSNSNDGLPAGIIKYFDFLYFHFLSESYNTGGS